MPLLGLRPYNMIEGTWTEEEQMHIANEMQSFVVYGTITITLLAIGATATYSGIQWVRKKKQENLIKGLYDAANVVRKDLGEKPKQHITIRKRKVVKL